jgi:hypothetical protein
MRVAIALLVVPHYANQFKCLTSRSQRIVVSQLTAMTITMYGADWCGDCVRAKKFFADNNIDFQKVDLELDENEHFIESGVY